MGDYIKIIKKEDYKTSSWSGGTTTELLIFPSEALYSERNFKWRLSSASVNVEASTFTSLPGISRIIMVLQGELFLEHEGHYKTSLKNFQQDSFCGDWITRSYGKATDFNLMMNEGCIGKLEVISIKARESFELSIKSKEIPSEYNYVTEVFYCTSGKTNVQTNENKELSLLQGDLIHINGSISEEDISLRFYNKVHKDVKLIRSTIYY